MALVDFTTYTELDDSNEITVAENTITLSTLAVDEKAYVVKDYGAGYFSGNLKQRFNATITEATYDGSDGSGIAVIHALSDTDDTFTFADWVGTTNGILVIWGRTPSGAAYYVSLYIRNPSAGDSYTIPVSPPFTYYFELERVGLTVTLKIYSDAYTTLVDTLTATLNAAADLRYHVAAGGNNGVADADTLSGTVDDFEELTPTVSDAIAKVGGVTYSGAAKVGTIAKASISKIGSVSN